MAIELPSDVVTFLQCIGGDWPQVNEDAVCEFAAGVQTFAQHPQAVQGHAQTFSGSMAGLSYA